MTTPDPPPLAGIKVLEFAGLAPGPFAGLLLADYGAEVIRIDRAVAPSSAAPSPPPPTADNLTRRKTSIAVDLKSPSGLALITSLIPHVDVVIDPYRPGVLEAAGLSPEKVLRRLNPRLVVARMTGFRRDGKYRDMAGHDINYLAVAGVLGMLGRRGERPYAPGNILGDFAGGGAVCFVGILLALLWREKSGHGQVVEANMVDGSAFMATFPRLAMRGPLWERDRGDNVLDGGCPYYDTYETKDGKFMAVGALEDKFFAALLHGLSISPSSLPGPRLDRTTWPHLRRVFKSTFLQKPRAEWEAIFDGTDACVTPVLEQRELAAAGYDQRPLVTLQESPGYAVAEGDSGRPAAVGQGLGVEGAGWAERGLRPGEGGEEVLRRWVGWKRGVQFESERGGLVWLERGRKARL
ncbi:CoA-transferase family III domain-containing protein [Phyllosticta capitalensis]|uniref:Alpha-methylacyl-CoA racemase-like protein n=1 Tax=Phyllosticta capitalensis TaxID=121624 RepID=A0ABR1YH90_9PEZI